MLKKVVRVSYNALNIHVETHFLSKKIVENHFEI